jgi:cytochrome c oxidase assembly factor CtaG
VSVVLPLALAAGLYGAGVARVRRWRGWRSAAFALGLLALGAALLGPDRRLPAHMVEHVLVTVVAPPLLVLGAPHVLALRALRGDARAGVGRMLGSRPVRMLERPPVAWSLFAVAMLGAHVTPLFGYAQRHPLVHAVEHLLLLGAAIAFWSPVLAAAPARRLGALGRVGYLFAAMAPMGAIGADYVSSGGGHDRALAGAIMWVGGGYALLAAVLAAAWGALVGEERRERAREMYAGGRR